MTDLAISEMAIGIICGIVAIFLLAATAVEKEEEKRNNTAAPGIVALILCLIVLCVAVATAGGHARGTPAYDVQTGNFTIISWGNSTDTQGNQYIDAVLFEAKGSALKYFHLPRERLTGEIPTNPIGDLFSIKEVKGWNLYEKTFTIEQ